MKEQLCNMQPTIACADVNAHVPSAASVIICSATKYEVVMSSMQSLCSGWIPVADKIVAMLLNIYTFSEFTSVQHCSVSWFCFNCLCMCTLFDFVCRKTLRTVQLSGPTFLAHVIAAAARDAAGYVNQLNQHYTVLLIITDGIITDMVGG